MNFKNTRSGKLRTKEFIPDYNQLQVVSVECCNFKDMNINKCGFYKYNSINLLLQSKFETKF